MRILFLIRALNRGGAERQLINLANGLVERGHGVHIALFYAQVSPDFGLDSRVAIHDLRKRGRWDVIGVSVRFLRLCFGLKPDIVHGYLPTANLITCLARALLGIPIVWGLRATTLPYHLYEHGKISGLVDTICRWLGRMPARIICNSEAGREAAIGWGFPPGRLRFVPNGIDTRRWRPEPELRDSRRAELGFTAGTRLIGLPGRLDPVKGISTFIAALAELLPHHPEVRGIIVGHGPAEFEQELRAEIAGRNLTDYVKLWNDERIDRYLPALDLGVSSSLSESFSNTIAEMMAAGIPCVATSVGDSARIIGDTGLTVEAGSASALASGLQHLLAEAPAALVDRGARARRRIEQEFSIEALTDRTEAELLSIHHAS